MDKCKVNYCMTDISGNELSKEKTRLERGLSVNESDDLKWSYHVNGMIAKANRILGMLKITFQSMEAIERSVCFYSKTTLRVRCASLEYSLATRN